MSNDRSTPRLSEEKVRAILTENGVDQAKVAVLAIRGYKLNTMGKPGQNDRRIYDDAHFIVWPDGMAAFVANTDPNGTRNGHGTGRSKGMAMLAPGIHIYCTGKHKGRLAFTQGESFTVIRDGNPPYKHRGWHAINWHDGGNVSTSSLGCQTNPRDTFKNEIQPMMYRLLDRFENPNRKNARGSLRRSFPYVLIEETERRKGDVIASRRYLKK